jgi:hypothetical protein
MTRKLRVPKAQVGALPSPSWTYWLLVGKPPGNGIRLPGWPWEGFLWRPIGGTPGPDEIWAQHSEALIAEARAADFSPWWPMRTKPRGPAATKWADGFCRRHSY